MNTYLSSVQFQRSGTISKNINLATRVSARRGLGPISNLLFMAVIVTLMGIMYLSQVTKANDFSFTLSTLESRKTELVQENQELSLQAARLVLIDNIASTKVAKSLANAAKTEFVR